MFNLEKKKLSDFKSISVMFGIGGILLIFSLIIKDGIFKIFIGTISSYLIVSSVLDFFNKCNREEELINKVCDCINGESNATKYGVLSISDKDNNKSTDIINEAKESIDIMHVYGRSWTSNNRANLINSLKNKNIKIRVILADYEDKVIVNLYNRQYNTSDIESRIKGVLELWKEIYVESGEKNNLEIYLYSGSITSAIYLNDTKSVALHFCSYKKRHNDEMTEIECVKNIDGLFNRYKNEIEYVISESRKFKI